MQHGALLLSRQCWQAGKQADRQARKQASMQEVSKTLILLHKLDSALTVL